MDIEVRENGTLVYDGIAVGRLDQDDARLVLNLGWMKAAGLKITVEGDPSLDRRRVVLARPVDHVRTEQGDQLKLGDESLNGEATEPAKTKS